MQELARLRLREARVLLKNQCFAGAYYLAGYAVECALKACIAKRTTRHEFPDRKLVNDIHTHDLKELVKLAGLSAEHVREMRTNRAFEVNWGVVKDWRPERRYTRTTSKVEARDLYGAIAARKNGVLAWIRPRW